MESGKAVGEVKTLHFWGVSKIVPLYKSVTQDKDSKLWAQHCINSAQGTSTEERHSLNNSNLGLSIYSDKSIGWWIRLPGRQRGGTMPPRNHAESLVVKCRFWVLTYRVAGTLG